MDVPWTTLLKSAIDILARRRDKNPKISASVKYYPSKYAGHGQILWSAYLEVDNLGPGLTTVKHFCIKRWSNRFHRFFSIYGKIIMPNIRYNDIEYDEELGHLKTIPYLLKQGQNISIRLFDGQEYSRIAAEGILSFEVEHIYGSLKGNVPPPMRSLE